MRRIMISLAAAALMAGAAPAFALQDAVALTDQQRTPETMDIGVLTQKAQAGDARAQVRLGDDYYVGNGVGQDYAQAFRWYDKAARAGDPEAQTELGVMYAKGQGVAKD